MSTRDNDTRTTHVKCLSKGELRKANRRAIKSGCRAIDPSYIKQLPTTLRYPVFFTIPWERHGWVRCHVGTATDAAATDYRPLWLDVPQEIYDNLTSIEVNNNMEVTQ
jgi:hypothetical protein